MPNVIVTRNSYPDAVALENVIHYVLDKAVVVGGYAVDCGSDCGGDCSTGCGGCGCN